MYWAPILVSGICQTESYARALLVTEAHDTQSPEERLAGRMQRQEILSRPNPPTVTVIMSELVLWRPVGYPDVMHEQVAHPAQATGRPGVGPHAAVEYFNPY